MNIIEQNKEISTSITVDNRKYTGFNVLNSNTLILLSIISSDEYLINDFSNKQIRIKYFDEEISKKEINKMTQLLAKLRAHGIIKKVARKISII